MLEELNVGRDETFLDLGSGKIDASRRKSRVRLKHIKEISNNQSINQSIS
jgi:hypothetical protein